MNSEALQQPSWLADADEYVSFTWRAREGYVHVFDKVQKRATQHPFSGFVECSGAKLTSCSFTREIGTRVFTTWSLARAPLFHFDSLSAMVASKPTITISRKIISAVSDTFGNSPDTASASRGITAFLNS